MASAVLAPAPTPRHLSLSLSELADLLPTEDASSMAMARYHFQDTAGEVTDATVAAAAEQPLLSASCSSGSGARVSHAPAHAWLPQRITSKEQLEAAVQLVQSRTREMHARAMQVAMAQAAAPQPHSLPLPASTTAARSHSPIPRSQLPPPAAPPLPAYDLLSAAAFPPPPPAPVLPPWLCSKLKPMGARLRALQSYLRAFEYNHLGAEFHPVSKTKTWDRLVMLAREMAREALPIKCLEAVLLAAHVTREWEELTRMPLRFKTKSGGHSYWHIVMAVVCDGKFGSVGLSRRSTLDYRPLLFPSLSALIASFRQAYAEVGHEMHYVTIGLPFPRKEHAQERVFWHFLQTPVLQRRTRQQQPQQQPQQREGESDAERQAELSVLEEIWDRFYRISPKLSETMRKASAAAMAGSTVSASSAAVPSLFVSPSALKSGCGVPVNQPLLHAQVAYDSAEVALIYHPLGESGGASSAGGVGVARAHAASAKDRGGAHPVASDDECDSSGSSSDEQGHAMGAHSDSDDSRSSGDDASSRPRRSSGDSKNALSTPALVRLSSAQQRRAAERAERRRNRQLVAALKDRYRHPESMLPPPPPPPPSVSPSASPAGMATGKRPPSLRLGPAVAQSPVRSPQPAAPLGATWKKITASPSMSALSKSFSAASSPPPPALGTAAPLHRASSASQHGVVAPLSARMAASPSTVALMAAASHVRQHAQPARSRSSMAATLTRGAPHSPALVVSPPAADVGAHARKRPSVSRSLARSMEASMGASLPQPLVCPSPEPSAPAASGSPASASSPPVGEGTLPPVHLSTNHAWVRQTVGRRGSRSSTQGTHTATEAKSTDAAATTARAAL